MGNSKLVAVVSVVLIAVAALAYAQGGSEKELKAGDQAPEFSLPGLRRQDAPARGPERQDCRPRLVPQSLHRWLNG